MQVDFNINILTQLQRLQPDKFISLNKKFPKIDEWVSDKKKPTFDQLEKLAKYFNIPFGYFFLNQIPVREYPITHYRTITRGSFKPSDELLDTIAILEERQKWANDILQEFKDEPLQFADSTALDSNIEDVAQYIREILNVHENWAKNESFNTWYDAFKFLLTKTENAGIFVVQNGVVGNNTYRKLNVNEFRGFVLYDEYAPFIFINGNDFISGRIFTLIHEIAHILIGKSASFDYSDLQPANDTVEEFCDAVAAEFLVSKNSLTRMFKEVGKDYQHLSAIYKVSKIVIMRRLLDLELISLPEFLEGYNSYKTNRNENTKPLDAKGGDFYNTASYRISRNFFNLLYSAVKQDRILYRDAFQLAGLTPKTFDGYVDKYIIQNKSDGIN